MKNGLNVQNVQSAISPVIMEKVFVGKQYGKNPKGKILIGWVQNSTRTLIFYKNKWEKISERRWTLARIV